jgi:hypothetical protein
MKRDRPPPPHPSPFASPQNLESILSAIQGIDRRVRPRLDAPPPTSWETLPPKMRGEVAERLFEIDPATLLQLYATNRDARDLIDGLFRRVPAVDDRGNLVSVPAPLVAYARQAIAFGETDPVRLLLRMVLCILMAVADRTVSAFDPAARLLFLSLHMRNQVTSPVGRPHPRFSALVQNGLSDDQFDQWTMTPEANNARGHYGLTYDDTRRILMGPLGGDIADIVSMWWDWLRLPDEALALPDGTFRSPVAERYAVLFGWRPPLPVERRDLEILLDDAVAVRAPESPATFEGGRPQKVHVTLEWNDVLDLFGPDVPVGLVRRWFYAKNQDTEGVLAPLREAVSRDADAIARRAIALVASRMVEYGLAPPPGPCAAVLSREPGLVEALFRRLFAPSTFWLVPMSSYSDEDDDDDDDDSDDEAEGVQVFVEFASPAIDEALARARGHTFY